MPAYTPSAGALNQRVAFERRSAASDDYGGVEGDWLSQFEVAARIVPRLGGEEIMAARLAGRQPVTITIRCSRRAAEITTAWRARNVRSGEIYNIRSIANVDERRAYLDLLCDSGVAT